MDTYPGAPFGAHLRFMRSPKGWEQGDHILISAPTKAGKTTLASKLLGIRSHSVIFVTKLQDPTFAKEFGDWERITEWPKGGPAAYKKKLLLWPKPGKTLRETQIIQRDVFAHALDEIARQGNRCVCVDETLYMSDPKFLNLGNEIGMMHYFGRSSGISMVTLSQRPAWIPKVIYSSVSHAYIARTRDANDAKRLSDLGGVDAKEMARNLSALPTRHDYVYCNPQGDALPAVVNTRR